MSEQAGGRSVIGPPSSLDAEFVSDTLRLSQARTATAISRAAAHRRAQPNGWWGMALFLCSEVTLFGTLIGSYFYLDFKDARWPPAGISEPSTLKPSVSTGVLVAMSIPLWLAVRQARAGRKGHVLGLITLAFWVQLAYLGFQIWQLIGNLHHFLPHSSAYGSIYYTLLVAHHAHVLFGLVLDVSVFAFVAIRGLDNYWLIGVRGLAMYWYVVNGLAVAVLLTTLSPSL